MSMFMCKCISICVFIVMFILLSTCVTISIFLVNKTSTLLMSIVATYLENNTHVFTLNQQT